MPTLTIGDKRVKVSDDFLKLSPEDQANAVEEIATSLGVKPAAPAEAAPAAPKPDTGGGITADNVVRAAARGIPVVGGVMDKVAAGMDAATQPVLGRGATAPTLAERYAQNLAQEKAKDKAFDTESPITSATAQVAGGVASLLPAAATQVGAKILGMSGTLPQMIRNGALSGAALSAADAAVRGENPVTGAEVGGAFGALAPVGARAIGEGARAIKRMVAPAAAPVQNAAQQVVVGNTPVRMSQSQMTGDAAQSAEEQILARGGRGEPAQQGTQAWKEAQQAELKQASDELAAGLDPTGRVARTTPQQAAEAVSSDLASTARQNAVMDDLARHTVNTEGRAIATEAGGGRTVADAPYAAAEIVGEGVRNQAANAARARTAAYEAARQAEIEVAPAAFSRLPESIGQRLSEGDRVRLNDRTPNANDAMDILRRGFGATDQQRPPLQIGPDGRPQQRPVTGTDIDEMRKDLIQLQRQASSAARGPGGDATDQRAMRRILAAFDDHVEQAVGAGTIKGDGQEFLRRLRDARRLHSEYKQTYGPRDAQDEVGKVIDKIVGRGADRTALPDQIVASIYGTHADPGGALQVRVAQRLRDIFGENSREWAAHKQGLLAYVTEAPPGAAPYTPEQVANRVEKLLNGNKGRGLAEEVFSPAERTRLASYAAQQRSLAPRPVDSIDKVMARIAGADGNPPASVNEVLGYLYGSKGMGSTKTSVELARRLKVDLTPESWHKVRQGMWSELTDVPEGMIAKKEQALSQRLHDFLHGDGKQLAEVLFSKRERELIQQMAGAYKRMIPVEGTTNPSGTAPMLAKIASKAQSILLPLLGFSHGGMAGAAAGVAASRGVEQLTMRRAAKDAARRFYGEQPALPPVKPSRVPQLITQGAAPALTH